MRFSAIIAAAASLTASSAFAGPVFDAAKSGDATALADLLDGGADVNEPNLLPPLQIAAFGGHIEALSILIERGADLDATSTMIGTALHAASQKGYSEAVRKLIAAGANPDARNSNEFTPLMIASLHGHVPTIKALLAGGASVDAVGFGRTNGTGGFGQVNALHLARTAGYHAAAETLIRAGAAPKAPLDVSELFPSADPEQGRELATQRCDQCHKILSDDEVVLGPNQGVSLVGVYGRPIGSVEGFEYSDTLKDSEGVWTEDLIFSFAVDAMLTFPGTRMRWHDGWTDEEVAHIVAYFKSVAE